MKLNALFFFALVVDTVTPFPNNKSQPVLSGLLVDSISRQPVQNATVSLINSLDASLVAFTRSDETGRFTFKNLRRNLPDRRISNVVTPFAIYIPKFTTGNFKLTF